MARVSRIHVFQPDERFQYWISGHQLWAVAAVVNAAGVRHQGGRLGAGHRRVAVANQRISDCFVVLDLLWPTVWIAPLLRDSHTVLGRTPAAAALKHFHLFIHRAEQIMRENISHSQYPNDAEAWWFRLNPILREHKDRLRPSCCHSMRAAYPCLDHRPLGYEGRGKLQTQILCGADDNPRRTHEYREVRGIVTLV